MARKNTRRKKKSRFSGFKKWFALFIVFLLLLFTGYGYINSRIVHVSYAEVYIDNLSSFLDGTTILFASDFKFSDSKGASRSAKLLHKLSRLKPDILILGGDYTGMSLGDIFKVQAEEGKNEIISRLKQARMTFFSEISSLYFPGGKFAVTGDGDIDVPDLLSDCRLGGVTLIDGGIETAAVNGFPLMIASDTSPSRDLRNLTSSETVIVLAHNPDRYRSAASVTDSYGNAIADLVISGHTLGGQINLFGKGVMSFFGGYSGEFLSGKYNPVGPHLLVSEGVGCDWIPLRFGSRPEVFMITLKRK